MAGFPHGGSGSIILTSPDGSIDVAGTGNAPTIITDMAKVVRSVNGTFPTSGNVTVSTGSVTITSPDGSIVIGGTSSAPTLITNLAEVVRTVNNTSPISGNVNVTSTQAFNIATGMPTDGVTSCDTYLNPFLTNVGNTTGGFVFVPPCANPYVSVAPIVVPDHTFLIGLGYQWMKKLPIATALTPAVVSFQTKTGFPNTSLNALIQLGYNSGVMNLSINAGSTSTSNWAPVGLSVTGAGNILNTISTDGGNCGLLEWATVGSVTDAGIDNSWYNVETRQDANSGSYYYGTTVASGGAAGTNTFTMTNPNSLGQNIAAIIQPGMAVIDTTNPSRMSADSVVQSISGNVITLNNNIGTTGITGDTICFVGNAAVVKGGSDQNNHGWRSITGTSILAGADTQLALPHFSSGGGNYTHNLIAKCGQGLCMGEATLDSAISGASAADAGHVWRLTGQLLMDGGRIQCGTSNATSFPCITDPGANTGNGAYLFGVNVVKVGNSTVLDALYSYSNQFFSHATLQGSITTGGWMSTGTTPKANANDQYNGVVIDPQAINTYSDALSVTQPRISVIQSAAGTPSAATPTPFLGSSGMLTWGPSTTPQFYRSDLISSWFDFAPADPAAFTQTVLSFAGLGNTIKFVPHLNGTYRARISINCNIATTNGLMTYQIYASDVGTTPIPANGASTVGTTATKLLQSNINHQASGTGNHTFLTIQGEFTVNTNLDSVWWVDLGVLLGSATGPGGPSLTLTILDSMIEGPLQVIP